MFTSFSISCAASTSAAPVPTVIQTPHMGSHTTSLASATVVDSPEEFRLEHTKKRSICGADLDSKRQRLSTPSRDSSLCGFTLDSEISIFDSDGLISLPGSVGPSTCADQQLNQEHLTTCSPYASPAESVMGSTPSSCAIVSTVEERQSVSQAHSLDMPLDSDDASMLQLTIMDMISRLRHVSDIASSNPHLAQQVNLSEQVDTVNEAVCSMVRSLSTGSATSAQPSMPSRLSSPQLSPLACTPQPGACPPIYLRVSEMETVWYADRPFPPVECELVSAQSNQRATHLGSCRVRVSLVDGNGSPCEKLAGQASSSDFIFSVSRGVAEISGLRFSAVSSKHHGFFQLSFTVLPSVEVGPVLPLLSDKIQVLSYRLFHAPKVDFSKLSPSDSLTKVKGIGSLYAKRFAAIGVDTVEHLAELDVEALHAGSEECKSLLESLRKDRGALTLAKLNDLIVQARGIVIRAKPRHRSSFGLPCGMTFAGVSV